MTEQSAIVTKLDESALENVLIGGDLSKLTSPQRVQYYKRVCESLGLNPFTKPFEYITLNQKLTLYAKKDATDQLRSIQGVSIDDVDIQETATQFIVKVKGHNRDNRQDVEVGVVNKSDMQGNLANAQMKAVTKGKRRLTLSLCGLGWLDETEIETIKDAKPVNVTVETGEILEGETESPYTVEEACNFLNSKQQPYGTIDTETLRNMANALANKKSATQEDMNKVTRIQIILKARADGVIKEPEPLKAAAEDLGGQEQ